MKKKINKKHKHFYIPLAGYKNPDSSGDYSGRWAVEEVYCAYCLKIKTL